ncbi:hypothetical protein SERLADRAFT_439300 [Serpula lacrymans var. lacrymans S7.9]|uniref:Uncharacterized protein n=1 Tax=Serpula lacrymans var. lacrymans (strain S7.9) TaxID=578457 RepID=F8NZH2_SERL9|nr:uncharacterized protein SERLADRAFT_439300 [Serpula lacrymans var. lacrymans S7.9]EGO23992.1 hypothetical protein SERLADRAFT_439300 [Serpula lacrymans var. lacrymans S7.9]
MPEKVVSQTEEDVGRKKLGWFHLSDMISTNEDTDMPRMLERHAFHLFVRQGGKPEDWGEHAHNTVREEILQRWKTSEWGGFRKRKVKDGSTSRRWVGGSFQVGSFLGLDVLEEGLESVESSNSDMVSVQGSQDTSERATGTHAVTASSATGQSFMTARSQLTPDAQDEESHSVSHSSHDHSDLLRTDSVSSSTALLVASVTPSEEPSNLSQTDRRPFDNERNSVRGAANNTTDKNPRQIRSSFFKSKDRDKGKQKQVHYSDYQPAQPSGSPAPPSEVLSRSGDEIEGTSAGATSGSAPQKESRSDNFSLRDRMLVRVIHTKSPIVPVDFDEEQNRLTGKLELEKWSEFMVIWQHGRVELYEDFNIPGKEWVIGHKHLAYIIPLKSTKTRVSLYSFVDLTFCLTCPPTSIRDNGSKARKLLQHPKEGTNIFIFKLKSRTRALDWTWHLWRRLGGKLPAHFEIHCPNVDASIEIDIPVADVVNDDKTYILFHRQNIIDLCQESLSSFPEWKHLIGSKAMEETSLELAWRMGTEIDWVWHEEGIDGKPREWAVVCGLALKQSGKVANLELRPGEHFPGFVLLKNGRKLHEPAAVEGYLDRIKPNSQTKQQIYLVSHDGNLFVNTPAYAHPPSPPTVQPSRENLLETAAALRSSEVNRGSLQIKDAHGVTDLRNIRAVRRATEVIPQYRERPQYGEDIPMDDDQELERTGSDIEDEGGDEGLSSYEDKARRRMRRSFEIVLLSGLVIRFEAFSCQTCLEWIERLRLLVIYWRIRHRTDAQDEMEISYSGNERLRVTPHQHVHANGQDRLPEPPADPDSILPTLGAVYNWCVLTDCRSILKGGRIFTRKGLRGQYKYASFPTVTAARLRFHRLVQLLLISGHLVQYHVTPKSSLHHRRTKDINLLDAYVCSGYLAAMSLRRSEYNPGTTTFARRYQDGLEAVDLNEDVIFVIWYRKKILPSLSPEGLSGQTNIPSLSAKKKIAVFRARSKVERDAWCWALNCEIEKLVRVHKDREEQLRETGGPMKD